MSVILKRRSVSLRGRNTAKHKAMAKAVSELAALRKADPARYAALIRKHANQTVRIVAG